MACPSLIPEFSFHEFPKPFKSISSYCLPIMSVRSKYSHNGVHKFENFAQLLENADSSGFWLSSSSHFGSWYIKFNVLIKNGRTLVYPFLSFPNSREVLLRAYFNIIKKDGSSAFEIERKHVYLTWDEGCIGKYMDIEELLDEDHGYLDNGALTMEYGIQVESEVFDGIWLFNFIDPLFDSKNHDNMFTFPFPLRRFPIHCHKQPIKLHSNIISDSDRRCRRVESSFDRLDLVLCLQIAHGVRPNSIEINYRNVAEVAFHFGFFNTVRYCERDLIEMDEQPRLSAKSFQMAVKYNMRCYLIHLLKRVETKKQLINILRRLDLEKMSSESLKAIAAKFFF